ncbi:hypothetical protein NYE69_04095 [Paenibacillus sp. FSL R5-0527]|uniref:hypothetical protein n=1 Tax=Paenibacillus TaxID=44249 RepID=UPI00097B4C89|nr:hypothetical protein [Paenibacillus macerans]OMG47577.1 hypothetical protein BK140_20825 [Paenibacillus macerans]
MNRLDQALSGKPGLQLFVSLPANDIKLAEAALTAGADGLKVHINVGHRASGNRFGALDSYAGIFKEIRSRFDGPFGIVPGGSVEEVNPEEITRLPELGIDFYSIYAFHHPSFLLRAPGLARTFAIDSGFDRGIVEGGRAFGVSALEASIVPGNEYGTRLTLADLLHYRWLAAHTGLPVIVPTQRKIAPEDIPALADSGVKVLLVGAVVTGNEAEGIRREVAALRNAIDRL